VFESVDTAVYSQLASLLERSIDALRCLTTNDVALGQLDDARRSKAGRGCQQRNGLSEMHDVDLGRYVTRV